MLCCVDKVMETLLMRMRKMYNRIKIFKPFICILILVSQFFTVACSKSVKDTDSYIYDCSGGFIVKGDRYLFYNQYEQDAVNLYRYDLANNKAEYIDNITNKDTNFFGLVKMFVIDNRVYYGKSTSDDNISEIYSVAANNSAPRYEGSINDRIDAFNGEDVESEFKIFKYDNALYVLTHNNIYRLNSSESERVIGNISSIYISGDEIYDSLLDTGAGMLKGYGVIMLKPIRTLTY